MSHKSPAYVIFDGDSDAWAYRFMRGWRENDRVDFDFRDAHDLDTMTSRAQSEEYVKSRLRERMKQSSSAIVIVGENTRSLYRFVRWELDLALELDLPIIAVNLNEERMIDTQRCPPIIREACAVHVPFKARAIKYALDNWPAEYRRLSSSDKAGGPRHYAAEVYHSIGL